MLPEDKILIKKIDPSLNLVEVLASYYYGFGSVYKVEKEGSFYVLKMVNQRNKDTYNSWRLGHMLAEKKALKRAKGVEGITHLIEEYKPTNHNYIAILKEYLEGSELNKAYGKLDEKFKNQLEQTIKELHKLGIAIIDLYSGNIVVSKDESKIKVIDLGSCIFKDERPKEEFKQLEKHDFRLLEDLFT